MQEPPLTSYYLMKKQVLVPIWSFPKATLPQSSQPGVLAISQTMGDILESIKIQVVLLPWVCNSFWAQLHYYFLHDLMEGLHSSSRFSSITPSTKNQIFWNLTRTYCLYIPFYHTGLKESNKMHLLSSSCKNTALEPPGLQSSVNRVIAPSESTHTHEVNI